MTTALKKSKIFSYKCICAYSSFLCFPVFSSLPINKLPVIINVLNLIIVFYQIWYNCLGCDWLYVCACVKYLYFFNVFNMFFFFLNYNIRLMFLKNITTTTIMCVWKLDLEKRCSTSVYLLFFLFLMYLIVIWNKNSKLFSLTLITAF